MNELTFSESIARSRAATDALTRLHELIDAPADLIRATEPPYYSEPHDIASEIMRDLLIADDDENLLDCLDIDYYSDPTNIASDPAKPAIDAPALATELIALLDAIRADPYHIHELSMLRLDESLCPLHHCDYAICFDDDDPECAPIRACFPHHDT
jgi:hypothetical protein